MTTLEGRVALVTGAGGGIGYATALVLGELGMDVAVHYFRNAEGANEAVAKLKEIGRAAEAFEADLSQGDRARPNGPQRRGTVRKDRCLGQQRGRSYRAAAAVRDERGVVAEGARPQPVERILLHAGGGSGNDRPSPRRDRHVSSLAAHNGGGPGAFAYAAAKGALISFTKAIARELAPSGIRVNAVAPALIGATHFHERYTPAQAFENVVKTIPLGRAGTPEDVARVIAFLASDDSAYLAGETIDISGGLYMR